MQQSNSIYSSISSPLWLAFGHWLDRKGLPALAETCYRNAASANSKSGATAVFELSQVLLKKNANEDAARLCETALRANPGAAKLWCALGVAQRRMAKMEAAHDSYSRAVELDPKYAQAWNNLGEWHLVKGEAGEALIKFDEALRLEPKLLQALNNRVAALYELCRFREAEDAANDAIKSYPDEPALQVNLANVLFHSGKARTAVKHYKRALELDPASPEAHLGLSTILGESKRLSETLDLMLHQIAVKGENAQRLASLALAYQAKGDWMAAEETCEKVLRLQPNNISALVTLSGCRSTRADHHGAIRLCEQALAVNPDMPSIHSNIAFNSTYLPDLSAQQIFDLHREWAQRFERDPAAEPAGRQYAKEAGGPLRIGYVSGDFGTHPVGFLLRDVVLNHDRQQFRIYCYSMMRGADQITETIQRNADEWVDALFLSDQELADRIRSDQIDILVDLSGHTAYNRLPVFTLRPAPIQATWIGYFHSTGLKSIDYFITDPHTTPLDSDQLFSETPVWLPDSRFCYSPPEYAPDVSDSPASTMGTITFGSFNRVEKIVDPVVDAWARIVNAVPGSKLLLKSGALESEAVCNDLRKRFVQAGLAANKLELRGPSAHPDMLAEYGDVDIALDPFPFNGGMTTLEALWMGVPVITMAGNSVVSRQSTSALMNIGLPELIHEGLDGYIHGAIQLATDLPRLSSLRKQLRSRMQSSPLCQPAQFTHDLESLYKRMHEAWRKGEKLQSGMLPAVSPVALSTVLHVGCGPNDWRSLPTKFWRRWREIRLDIDPVVNPDIVASMLDMSPVQTASIDAVFSSHNIEHLHPHEVPVALTEFRRVLKPGGLVVLICPDLQSVCALVAEDKLEETTYVSPAGPIAPIDILYGFRTAMANGNLFMAHKTGFTATTMENVLRKCGFESIVVERFPPHALWALAYVDNVASERIAEDRQSCFPINASGTQ
jgi:predicted O-linked N-acetylglucosamine transferase (SPINDLY family)